MSYRKDGPNAVWHVTGRVNWRVWHLKDSAAYEIFLEELARALEQFSVVLVAFVVMSNHYHLVLWCPPEDQYRALTGRRTASRHFRPWPRWHPKSQVIGQCIRRLALQVSTRVLHRLGLEGHFWDGKHHRKRVWDMRQLVFAVAYDHRNPVRANMAPRPERYPRSSAAWWSGTGPSPVPIATRSDFPFGADAEEFRAAVLRFQQSKLVDDVMEAFQKSGLRPDSAPGRELLDYLLNEAGLHL